MGYANVLISLDHSDHDAIFELIRDYSVANLNNVFFIDTPSPMKAAEIAEELRDRSVNFVLYHINNKEGSSVLSNGIDADDKALYKQILMEVAKT
jgi:hypothetical protein